MKLESILVSIFSVCAFSSPAFGQDDTGQEITQSIENFAKIYEVPGIQAAVRLPNGSVVHHVYGVRNLHDQNPVDEYTRFRVGSITKTMTALMTMRAVQDGRIDLDQPVGPFFPWLTTTKDTTVEALMLHSAGYTATGPTPDGDYYTHLYSAVRNMPLLFAPGTESKYCNVCFGLLGELLEDVNQQSIHETLSEMTGALGMTDTYFSNAPEANNANTATGYLRGPRSRHANLSLTLQPSSPYYTDNTASAAVSTASDITKMAQSLLVNADGKSAYLEPSALEEILTVRFDFRGLGVVLEEHNGRMTVSHGGFVEGFETQFVADIETGMAVAVLTNTEGYRSPTDEDLALHILSSYINFRETGAHAPPLPFEPLTQVSNSSEYAGDFNGASGEIRVSSINGSLQLQHEGATYTLERGERDDVFIVPHAEWDGYMLQFWRNEEGDVHFLSHGPRWWANNVYKGPKHFAEAEQVEQFGGCYMSYGIRNWNPSHKVYSLRGALHVDSVENFRQVVRLEPLGEASPQFDHGSQSFSANGSIFTFGPIVNGRANEIFIDNSRTAMTIRRPEAECAGG